MSEEDTISKKKVRDLQLADEVVVGMQAGVREISIETNPQTGEELAKITVDGVEHSIRAPFVDEKTAVEWRQNDNLFSENQTARTVIGSLIVDGEIADVYLPTGLQHFDNAETQYQSYENVQSLISDLVPETTLTTLYATKAELEGTRASASEAAEAAALAVESVKELSNQTSSFATADYVEAAFAKTSDLSALATIAELNELKSDHSSDMANVNNRLDNIPNYSAQLGSITDSLADLSRIVAGLQTGGGSSGSSGSGEVDSRPLDGKTYVVENENLATLMDVVLKALGANGGSSGPLRGQTFAIDENDLSSLMKTVLEALGATVS